MELQFTVPGEPRGKGRPRFGNGRTYTDAKTVAYEKLIACRAAEAMPCPAVATPTSVRIDIYKGVPKSWTMARRRRALDGQEIPGKPDLDNVAKGVLDALNGVAYEQLIARTAAEAMRHLPYELTDLPCYVRVDVYKGVPKSWTQAKRARALDGQEIPGKPDLDNVAKAVLDALNAVVYSDDVQVTRLLVTKQYSLEPRLVVNV